MSQGRFGTHPGLLKSPLPLAQWKQGQLPALPFLELFHQYIHKKEKGILPKELSHFLLKSFTCFLFFLSWEHTFNTDYIFLWDLILILPTIAQFLLISPHLFLPVLISLFCQAYCCYRAFGWPEKPFPITIGIPSFSVWHTFKCHFSSEIFP